MAEGGVEHRTHGAPMRKMIGLVVGKKGKFVPDAWGSTKTFVSRVQSEGISFREGGRRWRYLNRQQDHQNCFVGSNPICRAARPTKLSLSKHFNWQVGQSCVASSFSKRIA